MNSRFLRAAITAASVFLVATGALAQQAVTPITLTAASFTPASTDLGVKLIDVIFGTQNAATATTTVNGFAAAINVLNLGAIAFGTLMFTYIAVIGTLKSAEDGELLGKKWSSMWVPLRFVMVIGLMVPAASGYSSGEMAVIWLAKMGSGLASAVWQAGGQVIATGGEGATATVNSPGYASALDTSMRKILAAEICSAGYRDRFADSLGGGASSFGMNITQQSDGSYLAEWGWHGDPNSQTWLPRECGKLQTPGLQAQQQQQLTMNDGNGMMSTIDMPAKGTPTAATALIQAQASGITAAHNALQPVAVQIVSATTSWSKTERTTAINAAVAAAASAYGQATQAAVQALYASTLTGSSTVTNTFQQGWIMSGTVLYTMASLQSQAAALGNWTPDLSPPSEGEATPPDVETGDASSIAWDVAMGGKAQNDVANTTGRGLAQWLAYTMTASPKSPTNILVQMKNAGDSIMTWTQAIVAAVGIGALFAGKAGMVATVAGKVTGLGGLASTAGEFLGIAVLILFLCGVTMSVVIPLMPIVLWSGSILGWLVAVAQAIIAAPIWLAAHMHPEGDDLTGKASNGYMILLELVLRPSFMVLGLLLSYTILDAVGHLVGYIFFATVDSVQSDSMTGLFSILGIVVVYVGLMFTLTRACFGLIHSVSASVLRWIGGAHAEHDKGAEFGAAAQGQVNQGLQRAEVPLGRGLTRVVGGKPDDKPRLKTPINPTGGEGGGSGGVS
jgi:hypothetical protein